MVVKISIKNVVHAVKRADSFACCKNKFDHFKHNEEPKYVNDSFLKVNDSTFS